MQPLLSLPLAGHRVTLPAGTDHRAAHALLTALLRETVGPEWAGLFATPAPEAEAIGFLAPDGRILRFAELDPEGRGLLRATLGRLAGELRRAAEVRARRNPRGAASLPKLVAAAIELPSFEYVFVQDGRPILAGWGMLPDGAPPAGLGLIARLDDGLPAPAAPAPAPWSVLALSCLALVALGAAAVAAVPHMVAWLAPEPAVCRIQPNGLPLLTDLLREQEREQALRHRLAELETSRGQRRANCPLPPPPPPPVQRVEHERPPVTPPEREQPREERAPGPSATEPPPNTMPCNQEAASGSQGVTRNRHSLGPQPGRVTLHYNTMQNPDHIRVWYRGQVIAETPGPVSYTGSISFDWTPPPGSAEDQVVEVEVTGRGRGTRWIYTLGCPGP